MLHRQSLFHYFTLDPLRHKLDAWTRANEIFEHMICPTWLLCRWLHASKLLCLSVEKPINRCHKRNKCTSPSSTTFFIVCTTQYCIKNLFFHARRYTCISMPTIRSLVPKSCIQPLSGPPPTPTTKTQHWRWPCMSFRSTGRKSMPCWSKWEGENPTA